MGITAHIVAVGNYWNNFANAQVPVTDSNINQNVGNSITSVPILDGNAGVDTRRWERRRLYVGWGNLL